VASSWFLFTQLVKCKVKVQFRIGHEDREGELYPSLTSALEGVGGQRHAPVALPRERPSTHCTGCWVDHVLDGCGKSRLPLGFDSRTAQLVMSRYTA